jgi:hypothetical protein
MRLKIDKTFIPKKLTRELRAAGVPVAREVLPLPLGGIYVPLVDERQACDYLSIVESVIILHDGIDNIEERVKNIPGWATWTEAEALEWFQTNIQPLNIPADVKVLLKSYGRMILALRDRTNKQE